MTTTVQRTLCGAAVAEHPPRSFSMCQRHVFRASARKAPGASFSACLVSPIRPIMHILLSKASVAEDRVSPRPTLPRAGTLAPGWYDSRAVLLELLYVSTAATASPAKKPKSKHRDLGRCPRGQAGGYDLRRRCSCEQSWRVASLMKRLRRHTASMPRPMARPVNQSLLRISGELDTAWAGITHDRRTASINACSMHGQSPSHAQHGVDR